MDKKYIDAEKLIAEIERRIDSWKLRGEHSPEGQGKDTCVSRVTELTDLLSFITSLQQEQPNKYETALEKARKWMPNVNQGGHAILIDIFPELGEGLDPRYGGRKQEQPEVDLEEAARHVYESWMGGTMDDVRRDMVELGKVLNARKED